MIAYEMIETKPEVMMGKPVIKGNRIPVDLIVRKLGEGAPFTRWLPESVKGSHPGGFDLCH
jgi:uncharacterized protein (DUF433 family)